MTICAKCKHYIDTLPGKDWPEWCGATKVEYGPTRDSASGKLRQRPPSYLRCFKVNTDGNCPFFAPRRKWWERMIGRKG